MKPGASASIRPSNLSSRATQTVLKLVCTGLMALGTVVVSPVSAAIADGGTYPSYAPQLTNGLTVTGDADFVDIDCPDGTLDVHCPGRSGVQYWRIALRSGDHLSLHVDQVAGYVVNVCVMSPSTSDSSVSYAPCLASGMAETEGNGGLTFTASRSGNYLIGVADDDQGNGETWAYSMTPQVVPGITPKVSLTGPRVGLIHHHIRLHGRIRPALSKRLTLLSKSPAHGWRVGGHAKPDRKGRFSFHYLLGHHGPHEFKVVFPGRGHYGAAISKVFHVRVP